LLSVLNTVTQIYGPRFEQYMERT